MPGWERRYADTLADAIVKHIRNHPETAEANAQLAAIQQQVDAAAVTVTTTPGELAKQRASVCAICRRHALYECDVPQGWSSNCALVYANTTEFGGL